MKIVLHAFDVAPGKNLALLACAAMQQGHHVYFVGGGMIGSPSNTRSADVVVTGLSSLDTAGELALGAAAARTNVPWIVLADTHQSWARTAARGKVARATLFVASPHETEDARAFGYGRVEYHGGPPLWQEFVRKDTPPFIRIAGITYILVAGVKNAASTNEMLSGVIAAMHRGRTLKKSKQSWILLFNPHPREEQDTDDTEQREHLLSNVERLTLPLRTTQLIPFVDLAVMGLGSTDTIAAAYQRTPVISYENDAMRNFLEKATGLLSWFPIDAGACVRATSETMDEAMQTLLSDDGRAALRQRQEEVYPLEAASGVAVEDRIRTRLEELVKESS